MVPGAAMMVRALMLYLIQLADGRRCIDETAQWKVKELHIWYDVK